MNFRRTPKRSDANYIKPWTKYKNQAKDLSTPAGNVIYGRSYTLGYNFSKDYDANALKYYDYFPLIYVINVDYEKGFFTGINLHHFPVGFREEWFRSILAGRKVVLPRFLESLIPGLKKEIPDKLKRISYERQVGMMRWVKTGVRNYRFDRLRSLRHVEPENLSTLLKLYADTYYAATATERVKHFYREEYKKR